MSNGVAPRPPAQGDPPPEVIEPLQRAIGGLVDSHGPQGRTLSRSHSGASSDATMTSDSEPSVVGPPQSTGSVFGQGQDLQLEPGRRPRMSSRDYPDVVQQIPALARAESALQVRGFSGASLGGSCPQRHHAGALPVATQMAMAMPAASSREGTSGHSAPMAREAAPPPAWVIEEVIDFGPAAIEAVREIDDPGCHRVCDRPVGPVRGFRGGLFDSCTKTICADEEKDRC
mmetsp:Transcript_37660/g.119731  ORF Transcript_37660/g.119731 Transcript_37660/m.119731 type:complete len:230 (-) Transcript_37660:93-782(-)